MDLYLRGFLASVGERGVVGKKRSRETWQEATRRIQGMVVAGTRVETMRNAPR